MLKYYYVLFSVNFTSNLKLVSTQLVNNTVRQTLPQIRQKQETYLADGSLLKLYALVLLQGPGPEIATLPDAGRGRGPRKC